EETRFVVYRILDRVVRRDRLRVHELGADDAFAAQIHVDRGSRAPPPIRGARVQVDVFALEIVVRGVGGRVGAHARLERDVAARDGRPRGRSRGRGARWAGR